MGWIKKDEPDFSGFGSDDLDSPDYAKPVEPIGPPAFEPVAEAPPVKSHQAARVPVSRDSVTQGDTAVANELKALARVARSETRRLVGSVLKIGKTLSRGQQLLTDRGKGTFVRWMRNECGYSKKTGYAYLQCWRRFGGMSPKVTNKFQPSAMTLLSRDVTPTKAIEDATQLAESGKVVTHATARKLVAKYTVTPKKTATPQKPQAVSFVVHGGAVVVRLSTFSSDPVRLLEQAIQQARAAKADAA